MINNSQIKTNNCMNVNTLFYPEVGKFIHECLDKYELSKNSKITKIYNMGPGVLCLYTDDGATHIIENIT